MPRALGIWVCSLWFASGCLEASAVPCGDQLCPGSLTCDEIHGACVRPEQLTLCAGRPDGELCEVAGTSGFHCDRDVCVLGRCGDEVIDAAEECDDGAANDDVDPDRCRTTCRFAACGDGVQDTGEACDDGEANSSTERDACRDNCALPRCGDLVRDTGEVCDDGNTSGGDGCSPTCFSAEVCGNSLVEFTVDELCDDGNTDPGDGCDDGCQVEPGWGCAGEPTVCLPECGDGVLVGAEACDDANLTSGDGCDTGCLSEMGWLCAGAPSSCDEICGDSMVVGDELCDLGDVFPDDGCSPSCLLEFCGNGERELNELCDDGNNLALDGCAPDCRSDESCGNGVVDFARGELCDDDDPDAGDGCGASCAPEAGWSCVGEPSACTSTCGDGLVVGAEACDDDGVASGDGCNATCGLEPGWQCGGEPSACSTVCGDDVLVGDERCDDGNLTNGDGCDAACRREPLPQRVLAIIDSSGSMHANGCNATFTGGDGSLHCPGSDVPVATCAGPTSGNGVADDSRLHFTKEALKNVALSGGGSVEWALMRFRQSDTGAAFVCPTSTVTSPSGGWVGAGASPCTGRNAGDLLVDWSNVSSVANFAALTAWMDGASARPGSPATPDEELRGTGNTPLAGALASASTAIAAARATDLVGGCRPYSVVLVTDGDESCGGNPVTAAGALLSSNVPVHVISIPTATTAHDQIAAAGGTTAAIPAANGEAVFSALFDLATTPVLDELCNAMDDDCDGFIDEDFQDVFQPCDNGLPGACNRTGVLVCSPDSTTLQCSAPTNVAPAPETCNGVDDDCNGVDDDGIVPACGTCASPLPAELCNDVDDDCDGAVDEDTPGAMVPAGGIWIDTYEASRADATASSPGSARWRACSEPNRLPWVGATHAEAAAACAAQGKRLCTQAEWQTACAGPSGEVYPFGNAYDADACNGRDYDPNCALPDDNLALPTGAAHGCPAPGTTTCISDHGAIDLSGNVAEWTASAAGGGEYVVRGGSYNATATGMRCDFDLVTLAADTAHGDLGFRCCANAFPP